MLMGMARSNITEVDKRFYDLKHRVAWQLAMLGRRKFPIQFGRRVRGPRPPPSDAPTAGLEGAGRRLL